MVSIKRTAWNVIGTLVASGFVIGQVVKTKTYTPMPSDPKPPEVVSIVSSFIAKSGAVFVRKSDMELVSETKIVHGTNRSVWTVRSKSKLKLTMDMVTRSIISFHDFGREEAQFKGLQPKRKPLIQAREDARRRVEVLARKLGIPADCKPDSFVFKQNPGDLPKSAGRAGMTFANPAGVRVGGLSLDLLDGGVNGFWFAPWKVRKDARQVPTG